MRIPALLMAAGALISLVLSSDAAEPGKLLSGAAAFTDWRADAPGVRRKITQADLPAPYATRAASTDRATPWMILVSVK